MLGLSSVVLCLALVMRLYPEIPFSRQLNEQLIGKPLTWLATRHPTDLIYFIIVLAMLVADGEMIAMLGSAELFFVPAADINLCLHVMAVASIILVVSQGSAALQVRQAKLSFWHVLPALDVPRSTFGETARRKCEDSGSADNDDDPAPGLVIAA